MQPNQHMLINPILKGEVESAIWSLKNGNSPRIDIIAGELLKSRGENMITIIVDI